MLAWQQETGEIVHSWEFEILRAMDREYCSKMNEELQGYQAREAAKRKDELEALKNQGRR